MDRGLNRQLVTPLAEHRAIAGRSAPLDLLGVRLIEGDGGGSRGDGQGDDSGGTGDDDGGQDDDHDDDSDDDSDSGSGGTGFADLPPQTQAEIKRLRRENKTRRQADEKFRNGLADLLGFTPDGKPKGDNAPTERETELERENRQLKVRTAAERAIRKHGGDVDTVMDSNGFTGQLADLDPDDDAFGDELDSIAKKTVTSADRFKASKPRTGGGTREHGDGGPKERPKNLRDAFGRRNTK